MGSIVDFTLAVNANEAILQPTHLSGSVIQTTADHRPLSHPLTSNPGTMFPVANEYEWTGSVVVTNDSGNSNSNNNNQNNNSTESDCALVSTASRAAAVACSSQPPPKGKTQMNAVNIDKAERERKENKCERGDEDDLMPLGVESLAVGLGMANARLKRAQHASGGGAKEEVGGARLPEAQIRDNRETWTNKCEFLLAVIGYAVDLSNVRCPTHPKHPCLLVLVESVQTTRRDAPQFACRQTMYSTV